MFSFPTTWEFASLVCKLFLYFGAASIAGGSLCLWLYSDGSRRMVERNFLYIMLGSLLGFQAVIANFLIQIGLVNDDGLIAMFDWTMASLLLDTALGDMSVARLLGFGIAFVASLRLLRTTRQLMRGPDQTFYRLQMLVYSLALLLVAFSFRVGGHNSVLPLTSQVAITIHFMAFALWIGSLYPLLMSSGSDDLASLQLTMKRFGDGAIAIVVALLAAGSLMLWGLLDSWQEFISSAYGIALLIKFSLVLAILGVAAINRLVLVPRLNREANAGKLRTSIRQEMGLAIAILMTTSYLSTIIGPVDH